MRTGRHRRSARGTGGRHWPPREMAHRYRVEPSTVLLATTRASTTTRARSHRLGRRRKQGWKEKKVERGSHIVFTAAEREERERSSHIVFTQQRTRQHPASSPRGCAGVQKGHMPVAGTVLGRCEVPCSKPRFLFFSFHALAACVDGLVGGSVHAWWSWHVSLRGGPYLAPLGTGAPFP